VNPSKKFVKITNKGINNQYERLWSKRRSKEGYVASSPPMTNACFAETNLLKVREETQKLINTRTEICQKK
jgi:hypothetical protein